MFVSFFVYLLLIIGADGDPDHLQLNCLQLKTTKHLIYHSFLLKIKEVLKQLSNAPKYFLRTLICTQENRYQPYYRFFMRILSYMYYKMCSGIHSLIFLFVFSYNIVEMNCGHKTIVMCLVALVSTMVVSGHHQSGNQGGGLGEILVAGLIAKMLSEHHHHGHHHQSHPIYIPVPMHHHRK